MNSSTLKNGLPNSGIRGRLAYIAHGRAPTPWLQGYGVSKGSVSDILANHHRPKADTLLPMVRAENVSLHWLLDGVGAPFRVHAAAGDGEALDYLTTLFEEKGWHGMVYTDGARTVLVLTRPGEQRIRDRWHKYTILEVITGAGERSLALAADECRSLRYCRVDTASLAALARGETAGTYWLTQAPDPPFEEIEELPEAPAALGESGETYGSGSLTAWERRILDAARAVPKDQRERVLAVLEAFRGGDA